MGKQKHHIYLGSTLLPHFVLSRFIWWWSTSSHSPSWSYVLCSRPRSSLSSQRTITSRWLAMLIVIVGSPWCCLGCVWHTFSCRCPIDCASRCFSIDWSDMITPIHCCWERIRWMTSRTAVNFFFFYKSVSGFRRDIRHLMARFRGRLIPGQVAPSHITANSHSRGTQLAENRPGRSVMETIAL